MTPRLFPSLLAASLLLGACSTAETPASSASAPKPVEVAAPQPTPEGETVSGIGRLEAAEEAALAFTSAGVVAAVEVDIGDRVRAGQTLARLDSTVLDANVRDATEQAAQAKRDLVRVEGLVARQLVARQQLDDARTRVDVAEARLRSAGFGQRFGKIIAAADGTVLARLAEPGEVVAAGQPVLRVSGGGEGWVLPVLLADRDGLKVAEGAAAEVRFDAFVGEALPAVVSRVAGEASASSGGIVVELTLASSALPLRSGLVGKARIRVAEAPAGLRVPASALVDADRGVGRVFVVENGQAREREVRVGEVGVDGVQVLAGLADTDALVVGGAGALRDGDAVLASPRG